MAVSAEMKKIRGQRWKSREAKESQLLQQSTPQPTYSAGRDGMYDVMWCDPGLKAFQVCGTSMVERWLQV